MAEAELTDPFLTGWLNYLAFALSGLDGEGTLGAAVAFTLGDLYRKGATLDYPVGGSGAVIDALVRGIEAHGGAVRTRSHVEEIEVRDGRAVGVRLRGGEVIRAGRGVVSNADAAATAAMIPAESRPAPRPSEGGPLNSALTLTPLISRGYSTTVKTPSGICSSRASWSASTFHRTECQQWPDRSSSADLAAKLPCSAVTSIWRTSSTSSSSSCFASAVSSSSRTGRSSRSSSVGGGAAEVDGAPRGGRYSSSASSGGIVGTWKSSSSQDMVEIWVAPGCREQQAGGCSVRR